MKNEKNKIMVKIADLFEGKSHCNVLEVIDLTAPTFHVERSLLNTEAEENTREE